MGRDVRLLPAQYVKPYVKTNKNDAADAEAICEAVTRPTMRFVPIKEEMQQGVLVIHRVREMLIRQRTQLINGIRGHLAEFGIIGPNRSHKIGLLTKLIEDPDCDELPAVARHALQYLVNQLREVSAKLFKIDRDLIAVARNSNACRRLMSIPGVGVITATALASSMREPTDFKSGRHFAAWLGLVPRQHSTGGKESLGGISKRGNGYLRRLLIHGSRSIMRWRGPFLDLVSKAERQKTCQRCGSRDRQQDGTCRLGFAPLWRNLQPPGPAAGNEHGMILGFEHRWSKRLRG
ncbi:IS110 family transposase [Ensifer aridi]|uniref:IS110 family transposase n=1 Tax=Ensifer aridi TaxID=1708715 RepID=UPI003590184B